MFNKSKLKNKATILLNIYLLYLLHNLLLIMDVRGKKKYIYDFKQSF